MKTPSIKSLVPVFGDNAKEAKSTLLARWEDGLAEARDYTLKLPVSTPAWLVKMTRLNQLGDFSGVETIALGDGSFVDYLNAGDTYSTTLYRWRGNYYVGSWGDLVERHGSMDLQDAIARNRYQQH